MKNLFFFFAWFGASLAVSSAIKPAERIPAAAELREPSWIDLRAAAPSQILMRGHLRDRDVREANLWRDFGKNPFSLQPYIRNLEPNEAAFAKQAAAPFLATEEGLTYRVETSIEGRHRSILLQFRRDPNDPFGARARFMTTEEENTGPRFYASGPCYNEMNFYNARLNALVLHEFTDQEPRNGLFESPQIEFPLQDEPEVRGRIFALNRDTQAFEVIGMAVWKKIPKQEAPFYVKAWGARFVAAGPYHHTYTSCEGVSPEEPPAETF